uniref:Uncharacterized protein n=1 Tax=Peronospora matthiolae TaxID=2874970 RepID=A0AAV1V1T7_9STRA
MLNAITNLRSIYQLQERVFSYVLTESSDVSRRTGVRDPPSCLATVDDRASEQDNLLLLFHITLVQDTRNERKRQYFRDEVYDLGH